MGEKKTQTWIIVEDGEGARRTTTKERWPKVQEMAQWLIETAVKAGYSREEAERRFSVRIVKEYESTHFFSEN